MEQGRIERTTPITLSKFFHRTAQVDTGERYSGAKEAIEKMAYKVTNRGTVSNKTLHC